MLQKIVDMVLWRDKIIIASEYSLWEYTPPTDYDAIGKIRKILDLPAQ